MPTPPDVPAALDVPVAPDVPVATDAPDVPFAAHVPAPPIPVDVTVVETDRGEVWELAPDPMDAASRLLLRGVAAWAAEWAPGGRARLVIEAPEPTILGSGFLDPAGARALPEVTATPVHEGLAEELLEVWHAVVAAGGAVGFRREAEPAEIRPALERHLAAVVAGTSTLVTTREPGAGRLLGFGWWELARNTLFAHIAHLSRFQVRPDAQGRNLGRVQLAGMHRIARGMAGIELCELAYRSGTGVSRFYAAGGYVEVGRRPGAVRAGPADDRDSVLMMRRVDGGDLIYDGRG
ncbi:MAG: hypothetical protein M9891_05135 [Austwickia sp.]|nr:hypothetical protein [Actinomycetota bacterium]MCB1253427.1 hypothetical protein [Austwickia sp.]MCO5308665.1 hypothetical protein [Austwickia sp.]